MTSAPDSGDIEPQSTAVFINIGERTNVSGSARFRRLVLAGAVGGEGDAPLAHPREVLAPLGDDPVLVLRLGLRLRGRLLLLAHVKPLASGWR